ncbi:cytochrome P450 [Paraburkholderia phytofirmans]|uniref:cytochrome P450 n=1 Tax=Paraburkholderia phytofirmans TaxID=261302 RepID=UPI0038BA897F
MHGQTIRANDIVVLRWGAANRDERRFACPDALDLSRSDLREHLAFGHGIHLCPGRELAHAEVKIAFDQLLKRLKFPVSRH